MGSIIDKIKKTSLGKLTVYGIGIVLAFVLLYMFLFQRADDRTDAIFKDVKPYFHIVTDTVTYSGKSHVMLVDEINEGGAVILDTIAKDNGFERILGQFSQIRKDTRIHDNIVKMFYKMRYAFTILKAILALFATVMGLYISRNGWKNFEKAPLLVFLILGGLTTTLHILPESLNLNKNIVLNGDKYREYLTLENEVLSYVTTQRTTNGDTLSVNDFILYMDFKMNEAKEMTILIDDFPTKNIATQGRHTIK